MQGNQKNQWAYKKWVTPDGLKKIREIVGSGAWARKDLAKAMDLDVSTLTRWMTGHPEIAEAIRDGQFDCVEHVEDALYKSATEPSRAFPYGNPTAQIFFLCNRAPDKWKNNTKMELSGQIENTKSAEKFRNLTDDELRALAKMQEEKKA